MSQNGIGVGIGNRVAFQSSLPQPSLSFNFAATGTLLGRPGSATITFTRATSAWSFNSAGVLVDAGSGNPRFDHNPTTLSALGLLIEEQRTNGIRNNTMQGAVAGTPGTLPTNWTASGLGTLTREIVGSGTSGGIEYVDIRLSGTTSTTGYTLSFEGSNVIAATNGQSWTESAWLQVVGGSLTNITLIIFGLNQFDAGFGYIGEATGGTQSGNVGAGVQRLTRSFTTNNASVAFVRPNVSIVFSSGVAIDITLRIGLPQLEQGAFATSVIKTSGAAATRNASVDSSTAAIPTGAGTVVVNCRTAPGAGTQTLYSLDDGTANERIYIQRNSSNEIHAIVVDGGVTQCDLNLGTVAANTAFKVAFAWSSGDFEGKITGGTAQTDASGTLPTVTTRHIAHDYNNVTQWNSTVAQVSEYQRRLPSAQLSALVSA